MRSDRRPEPDDPSRAVRGTFNMTPMIDVTFQLIIVFLCSMRFRALDQKLDADLRPDGGTGRTLAPPPVIRPLLRVRLVRAGGTGPTRVDLQGQSLGETSEGEDLWGRLRTTVAAMRDRAPELEAEIDATPAVEHGEVVRALDGLAAAGLEGIRFRGTRMRR